MKKKKDQREKGKTSKRRILKKGGLGEKRGRPSDIARKWHFRVSSNKQSNKKHQGKKTKQPKENASGRWATATTTIAGTKTKTRAIARTKAKTKAKTQNNHQQHQQQPQQHQKQQMNNNQPTRTIRNLINYNQENNNQTKQHTRRGCQQPINKNNNNNKITTKKHPERKEKNTHTHISNQELHTQPKTQIPAEKWWFQFVCCFVLSYRFFTTCVNCLFFTTCVNSKLPSGDQAATTQKRAYNQECSNTRPNFIHPHPPPPLKIPF